MIKVYIVPKCDKCKEAKEYFNSKQMKYTEIDMSVGGNKETMNKKKQFKALGIKTYPIIIINTSKYGELIYPEFDKNSLDRVLRDYNE